MMWILLLALFSNVAQGRDVRMVRSGKPVSVVIIPENASPTARFAADELVHHVERISGAVLPVVVEGSAELGAVPRRWSRLYVGPTKRSEQISMDWGPHGFGVWTGRGEVVIVGDDAPGIDKESSPEDLWDRTGTVSGVYDVLQDQFGVRWLWPGPLGTVVPEHKRLDLPEGLRIVETPQLTNRFLRPTLNKRYQKQYLRNQPWLDAKQLEEMGQREWRWMRRMRLGRDVSFYGEGHAFTDYWDKYRVDHPEFFALLEDGTREPLASPRRIQMCVAEPALWSKIVERWQGLRRPPKVISVAENDSGRGTCTDSKCVAWDALGATYLDDLGEEKKSFTDRYIRFSNEVANRVTEVDPNARLRAYAYLHYVAPPVHVKPHPNLMIGWTRMVYPMTLDERVAFQAEWVQWQGAGDHTMYWRPNLMLEGYGLPFVYADDVARDFQFFLETGLQATDFDSMTHYWATGGALNQYVLGRMHWDTKENPQAFVREFTEAFGAGQTFVAAYLDHWTRVTNRWATQDVRDARFGRGKSWMTGFLLSAAALYNVEDFDRGRALLDQASAMVNDKDSAAHQRIEWLRAGLEHAWLTIQTMKHFDQRWRVEWMEANAYLPVAQRLLDARLEMDPYVTNVALMAQNEIRVEDSTGMASLRDTRGLSPAFRFPIRWQMRFEGDEKWVNRVTAGGIQWSPRGIQWMKAHDWELYNGDVEYQIKTDWPNSKERPVSALYFPQVDGSLEVWVDDVQLTPISRPKKAGKPGAWIFDLGPFATQGGTHLLRAKVRDFLHSGGLQRPVWLLYERPPKVGDVPSR